MLSLGTLVRSTQDVKIEMDNTFLEHYATCLPLKCHSHVPYRVSAASYAHFGNFNFIL